MHGNKHTTNKRRSRDSAERLRREEISIDGPLRWQPCRRRGGYRTEMNDAKNHADEASTRIRQRSVHREGNVRISSSKDAIDILVHRTVTVPCSCSVRCRAATEGGSAGLRQARRAVPLRDQPASCLSTRSDRVCRHEYDQRRSSSLGSPIEPRIE